MNGYSKEVEYCISAGANIDWVDKVWLSVCMSAYLLYLDWVFLFNEGKMDCTS